MGRSTYLILGLLDSKTRLVADTHCFIMQKLVDPKEGKIKEGDTWIGKYFYSKLGDAIRGYIKHEARGNKKKVISSKPLLDLIDLINSLENTVKEVGERLEKQFEVIRNDPVEKSIKDTKNA